MTTTGVRCAKCGLGERAVPHQYGRDFHLFAPPEQPAPIMGARCAAQTGSNSATDYNLWECALAAGHEGAHVATPQSCDNSHASWTDATTWLTSPEQPPLGVENARKRLMNRAYYGHWNEDDWATALLAAEAERDALRVALREIANHSRAMSDWPHTTERMQAIARAALGEQ